MCQCLIRMPSSSPCIKLFQKKLREATGAKQPEQLVSHSFLATSSQFSKPHHPAIITRPWTDLWFYNQSFPDFWVALARFGWSQFAKCDVTNINIKKVQDSVKSYQCKFIFLIDLSVRNRLEEFSWKLQKCQLGCENWVMHPKEHRI